MTKQILLAALLGGAAMFLWEGVSHELLPLGEAGIRGLDNEPAVVATVKDNVKQAGFYIFPGGDALKPGLSSAEHEAAMKKMEEVWRTGPSGIMIVHPEGFTTSMGVLFATQYGFDVLVTLIAAWLLSKAAFLGSYLSRLIFVTAIGLVPTINAELPLWNWYGFPGMYVLSQGVVHLVGFLVAGLIVAKLVKASPAPMLTHGAARAAA
jgi:hypothetical protein